MISANVRHHLAFDSSNDKKRLSRP